MSPNRSLPVVTGAPANGDGAAPLVTGRRRFCAKPFQYLEVASDGQAYLCCPSWLPTSIGYVQEQSLPEMWNGRAARELRESILNGSFAFCTGCPFLKTTTGTVRYVDEITDPVERDLVDSGSRTVERVTWLNLAYDHTCNLSCPSCRRALFVSTGAEYDRLKKLQDRLLRQGILAELDWLYVTGSGDPFASRLFRTLLRSIAPADYPRLRIKLHTNAQLFTPAAWRDIGAARGSVRAVEVSIDAACADTYGVNRRGGEWQTLIENLEFIGSLRRSGDLGYLQFSFVVQRNNWREMADFVALGRRFGVDCVLFTALRNWNSFSRAEYLDRAVHLPAHPEHAGFQSALCQPVLRNELVLLGDLAS